MRSFFPDGFGGGLFTVLVSHLIPTALLFPIQYISMKGRHHCKKCLSDWAVYEGRSDSHGSEVFSRGFERYEYSADNKKFRSVAGTELIKRKFATTYDKCKSCGDEVGADGTRDYRISETITAYGGWEWR